MSHFYQKNTYLLNHHTNRTFEEILWMSKEEFRAWCVDFRIAVVYAWDVLGIPPRVGYNEDEIADQFQFLESFPVQEFLVRDVITGEKNVIKNTRIEGNAVNQWFPTMMKTPINYTTDPSKGKSIYDFFSRDDLFERFVTYASRHFKRDSFYHYSLPVMEMDITQIGKLPVAETGFEWIKEFETNRCKYENEYSYWLCPFGKERGYSGYNDDVNHRTFLSVNNDEISSLDIFIPEGCKNNVDYKDTDHYHIRVFKLGQKIFPLGLKAFRVSFCQYATNFPSLTAKFIYETFTTKGKDNIVWDPSMGWGGRLVGALSVKDDRHITYLGNDPNEDHEIWPGYSKYDDLYAFYTQNVRKGGLWDVDHNDFQYWQIGSEEMQFDADFQKYKGKVDLVFTSPPYFMKEAYSNDQTQSYKKFDNWFDWIEGFLKPTLQTAYDWLRPHGCLCWNVSDVKFGNDTLPLIQTSIDVATIICKFKQLPTLKMCLASMPGGNRVVKGVPKTKYFVQVDHRYHKYEPCLVFQKP